MIVSAAFWKYEMPLSKSGRLLIFFPFLYFFFHLLGYIETCHLCCVVAIPVIDIPYKVVISVSFCLLVSFSTHILHTLKKKLLKFIHLFLFIFYKLSLTFFLNKWYISLMLRIIDHSHLEFEQRHYIYHQHLCSLYVISCALETGAMWLLVFK